jgi:CRP-like cAMP-binding protein
MKSRRKSPVNTVTTEPQHCSINLRLKILERVPFFAGLPGKAIEEIYQHFVEVGYQAGDMIYSAGDPAERLFVVADGKVKLLQHAAGGRNVLMDILASGEFFGNVTTLGVMAYPDTALAQTSACVLSIQSEAFRQLLDRHPGLALKALEIMSRRLNDANQRVLQLSSLPAENRIVLALLKLGEKLGVQKENGLLIDVPISRDELAEMTGTTPETASRVMSQLQNSGLIESGRQWVSLTDREGLEGLLANKSP